MKSIGIESVIGGFLQIPWERFLRHVKIVMEFVSEPNIVMESVADFKNRITGSYFMILYNMHISLCINKYKKDHFDTLTF